MSDAKDRVDTHASDAAQDEIIEEFSFFDDWMDRYEYLIDLGKRLQGVPEEERTEANRLHGCQSQVWLLAAGDAAELRFNAVSDSAIVCGLIALVLRVYSGRPAEEVLAVEPRFVEAIGLKAHLSPTRSNGLAAMLAAIRRRAAEALTAA